MKVEIKSVKEMVKLYTSGRIDVSMSWQRGVVSSWKKQERIDLLCDSMLKGFSIQAVHLIELASGAYELLDGKQRLTVISNVVSDIYPVSIDGGEPLYFSQWPQTEKDKFLSYVIPCVVLDLDDTDKRLQFERLAGGSPLSGMEKRRGSFVTLMSDLRFKGVVEALQGWGLKIAGNDLSKETIEEITLSALAYVTSGFNGSLGGDLSAQFKDNSPDFSRFAGLSDFLGKAGKVEKIRKGFSKKAALSSLLAAWMSGGDTPNALENVESFIFDKAIHASKGIDQQSLSSALSSGTGSKNSWELRVDILSRALQGKASKNVSKEVSKPSEKPLTSKGSTLFKEWGGEVQLTDCDKIAAWAEKSGCSDIKPRVEKSGTRSLAYIPAKGGYKVTSVSDLLRAIG